MSDDVRTILRHALRPWAAPCVLEVAVNAAAVDLRDAGLLADVEEVDRLRTRIRTLETIIREAETAERARYALSMTKDTA